MERVLALEPTTRSLAYAVLEGSERLLDWGLTRARKDGGLQKRLPILLKQSRPTLVVCASWDAKAQKPSVRRLVTALRSLGIRPVVVTRRQMGREYATVGLTKYTVAVATARMFPELDPWLPRKRMAGHDEDERAGIFVAVAAGFTVLRRCERNRAA